MNVRAPIADSRDMLEPFLTRVGENYLNPLTERVLSPADSGFSVIDELSRGVRPLAAVGEAERQDLRARGWFISPRPDWDCRFRLLFVSLEANSLCNQTCVFCPVSVAPRPHQQMPPAVYRRVVGQLAAYRETIRGVFMNNYNEPTADRTFVDQVRLLKEHGLPPVLNTNASGLTPPRVDQLLELGGLAHLAVNLSTVDRIRYRTDRGVDLLPQVLANLDYIATRQLAPRMIIAVLGRHDAAHERELRAIADRFRDSRFTVSPFTIMDRAQWLNVGQSPVKPHRYLRGCDQTGSRPLQHLHVDASGGCLLCCQDYGARYSVGNVHRQSVAEVLAGAALARYRRMVHGYEAAPDGFICRRCVFACAT